MSEKIGITDESEYKKYARRVKICTYCTLIFFFLMGVYIFYIDYNHELNLD